MGLTIHYSKGKIQSKDKIDSCIKSVEDIAGRLPCKYQLIDEQLTGILDDWANPKNPQNGKRVLVNYKGIILFLDEGSEPLSFSFDCDALEFCSYFIPPNSNELIKAGFFCKTQYAKNFLHTHHTACKFLEFIKKEFVSGLRVHDEGKYFGKWDRKLLKQTYEEWSGLISAFGKALDKLEFNPSQDIERGINQAAEEVYKDEKLKKLFG